jgi:hypothetical protein
MVVVMITSRQIRAAPHPISLGLPSRWALNGSLARSIQIPDILRRGPLAPGATPFDRQAGAVTFLWRDRPVNHSFTMAVR